MDRPEQFLGHLNTGGNGISQIHFYRGCRMKRLMLAQRGQAAGLSSALGSPAPLPWLGIDSKRKQEASTRSNAPSVSKGAPSTESSTGGRAGDEGSQRDLSDQRLFQRPQSIPRKAIDTETVVMFAYGANMNFVTLARRDVRVLRRDPAFVADPAVRLVFKHQGGYATLERAEEGGDQSEPRYRPYDGRVHGVLYVVTREDFEKLSKREGGYLVQELPVQTYDGVTHSAAVFVSNPLFKLPQEVAPPEQYLARVRDGARDNYLDPAYQAFLSGITTVPGTGLGSEYYNTPSKYMGYSLLVVVALITLAFFMQR